MNPGIVVLTLACATPAVVGCAARSNAGDPVADDVLTPSIPHVVFVADNLPPIMSVRLHEKLVVSDPATEREFRRASEMFRLHSGLYLSGEFLDH